MAQRVGFRLRWNTHSTRVSMEEFALVMGALLLAPHAVVAAIAASALANQVILRRPLLKAAFNVGQYTLAAAAAIGAYVGLHQLGASTMWAAVPVPFVFSFVSQGAMSVLFASLERTSPWRVFRERFAVWSVLGAFLGISLGMAAFALWSIAPAALLAILPVFALLARFGRLTEFAEDEARLHQALADSLTRVAQTGDFDEGANALLETAASALRAGEVRLRVTLRRGAPGEWRWGSASDAAPYGIRARIAAGEGEDGEIEAFPKQGQRPFGARERHLLELVGASVASAARAHTAMLALTEANRRLTNANRELEEFTLWTTHDMREPLRSVGQLAQILHEDLDGLSREEMADLTRRIHAGAEGLKERIKALHEFSRVVQQDIPFETVNLGRLVRETVAGLSARIASSSAHVQVPSELPPVRGQPARLAMVFSNLLENALKYNDKPTPRVALGYEDRADEVEFSVRDNGPGVEPALRERVFQLFQRGAVGQETGSGAGLAIVKRIVEQHGGRVWIEGAPGSGADFRFTLPKHAVAAAPPAQRRVTASSPTR